MRPTSAAESPRGFLPPFCYGVAWPGPYSIFGPLHRFHSLLGGVSSMTVKFDLSTSRSPAS